MSGRLARRWTAFASRPRRSLRDLPFWPLIPLGHLHELVAVIRGSDPSVGIPLGRPVISIGNLTVGGTGKTPATLLVAGMLAAEGLHPVILSRGYRRRGRGTVVVCDGRGPLAAAEVGGDEPVMMARALPQVPIYVDADRSRGAKAALARHADAVFVLDDGFSHRRVARNLDVVVVDASCPFGNGALLPAGPLREPKSALSRAGCIILNRSGELSADELARLSAELATLSCGAPMLTANYRALGLAPVPGGGPLPADGAPALSFAGIVNQRHFVRTLATTGVRSVGHVPFPDHHPYCEEDVRRLAERARASGAEFLVTTAKDAVKIDAAWSGGVPLAQLPIGMVVSDPGLLRELVMRAAGRG